MNAKTISFCFGVLLIKSISAQVLNQNCGLYSAGGRNPSCGGGFVVHSSSPLAPSGLSVLSEGNIEGCLGVSGQVPFLGAVALEGVVPSTGQSSVQYSCGDGTVGISEARSAPTGPFGGPLASPFAGALGGSLVGPLGGSLAGPLGGPLAGPLSAQLPPLSQNCAQPPANRVC